MCCSSTPPSPLSTASRPTTWPPPFWTDALALRPDFPPTDEVRLFNASFNALTYLHLHAVVAAYTPTHFQRGIAPAELWPKLRVLPDGVDVAFSRRLPRPVTVHGRTLPYVLS